MEPSAALKRKANEDENKNAPLKKRAQWDKNSKKKIVLNLPAFRHRRKVFLCKVYGLWVLTLAFLMDGGEHDVIKRIKSNKHQQA